jgi:PIN domain nuclease of toxin-antitoxin system
MTPSAAIDTHAAIWYLNADRRLSDRAKRFIDASARDGLSVLVSPISLVEVIYLCEKGRLPWGALTRLETALRLSNTVLRVADLTLEVALTVSRVLRDEVPDMPDRVIAATAIYFGVPVISRDSQIRTSAIPTIW